MRERHRLEQVRVARTESESARDDTCNAAEADEDTFGKDRPRRTEDASEKGAKLSKAADKNEDASGEVCQAR